MYSPCPSPHRVTSVPRNKGAAVIANHSITTAMCAPRTAHANHCNTPASTGLRVQLRFHRGLRLYNPSHHANLRLSPLKVLTMYVVGDTRRTPRTGTGSRNSHRPRSITTGVEITTPVIRLSVGGTPPYSARASPVSVRPASPSATSTCTRSPSLISPASSFLASASPIACWISRRSGRAP